MQTKVGTNNAMTTIGYSASFLIRAGLAVVAALPLAACGGGGGNDGVVSAPPVATFTSFSAVQAGTPTTISGMTREGSLTVSSDGSILPSNVTTPTESSGTATFTENDSKQLTSLKITGSQSSVSFDSSNSTTKNVTANGRVVGTAVSNSSGSDQAIYANPYALGFNYQTFGVWGTNLVLGGSGKFGAVSAGAKTSASSVPAAGTATFNGFAGGIYVDNNGAGYRYGATAMFIVNFENRTVGMSTNDGTITNISNNNTYSVSTPITSNMAYSSGSTVFSGNVQAGSQMSGTGSGTFYGPTANELGGTFFIRGSAGAMVGGFGGKQ